MTQQLISLINEARTTPQKAGQKLYNSIKPVFQGNDMVAFGKRIQTFEGIQTLQQLYNYMKVLRPTSNLIQSASLSRVAQQIANEKGQRGEITHESPQSIYKRIQQLSRVDGKICELIALGTDSSDETFSYFILDDGLVSRKRRRMILDPVFKYVGIGTSYHRKYNKITVLLLAENVSQ